MGKYTKFKEADEIVQRHLDVVVEKIVKSVSGLRAVILSGGFGRGEGSVEVVKGKKGGNEFNDVKRRREEFRILNDFDIYLITEKHLSDEFLEKLGKECSKLIGKGGLEFPENYKMKFDFDTFFNVDLRCVTVGKLRYLPPTVRYFEMKNATTLLWSRDGIDVRDLIPEIKPSDLPFSEGIRLLSNRMMNVFLSMKPEYLSRNISYDDYENPSHDEIGIANYYICKGYLACCEALLLFVGEFRASYEQRRKRFSEIYEKRYPKLYSKLPNLIDKINFMTEYKFNSDIKKFDFRKEWFEVRKYMTEIFKYLISIIIKKDFKNWIELSEDIEKKLIRYYFDDYAGFILNKLKLDFKINRIILSKIMVGVLGFLFFLKVRQEVGRFYFKSLFSEPGLKILSLTPLIFLSLNEDGSFDKKYKNYIERKLKSIYPIRKISNWKSMKENYLDVYKLYYLRRFV